LCSDEAFAAQSYKNRVVQRIAEDTVCTGLFNVGSDAPHRVLRNRAIAEWQAAGRPVRGERPGEGTRDRNRTPRGRARRLDRPGATAPARY
jgi:NAD(P)H-dependent flavin oxidoreductase YrpB (nitropropane dioxygenase family)